MSHASAIVDELANELQTWPGLTLERLSADSMVVSYDGIELGVLDRAQGLAELRFPAFERDELVEEGAAEPAEPILHSENVSHSLGGPSDLSAVLELFDRRYREIRGES